MLIDGKKAKKEKKRKKIKKKTKIIGAVLFSFKELYLPFINFTPLIMKGWRFIFFPDAFVLDTFGFPCISLDSR